jgi:hypothetical protein
MPNDVDQSSPALQRMLARREARYGHLRTLSHDQLITFVADEMRKTKGFSEFEDRVVRACNIIKIDLVDRHGRYLLTEVEGSDAEGYDAVIEAYGRLLLEGEMILEPNARRDLGKRLTGQIERPRHAKGPKVMSVRDRIACRLVFLVARYSNMRPTKNGASDHKICAVDIVEAAAQKAGISNMSYEAIMKAWRRRPKAFHKTLAE